MAEAEELRAAVRQLSMRGLLCAAAWAAEQLNGFDGSASAAGPGEESVFGALLPHLECGTSGQERLEVLADADFIPEDEMDVYYLGKTQFDLKEYQRSAHTLRAVKGSAPFFVRCYARYLASEKQKEEEMAERGVTSEQQITNPELKSLERELAPMVKERDPFCLYLHAIIVNELGRKDEARKALVESVSRYPWNWSAWLDLASLTDTMEILQTYTLPSHWMRRFFLSQIALELQQNEQAMVALECMLPQFASSSFVVSQRAVAAYNLREFDDAEEIFDKLFKQDPYRLEHADVFSNILFVKEDKAKLSRLAHSASRIDKYRPETCCIIGNYFSMRREHERAVLYFKRVLTLDKRYLSAWTLMGHEYLEMKNTSAAVEAYRSAVDINPKDFRAWYGLGQTYEILQMHTYALHYYRKAALLRPFDPRMWCAMADCYASLNRNEDAVKCYEKVESNRDREGIALDKLAKLYVKINQTDRAAHYYHRNLSMRDQNSQASNEKETIDALLFLANYSLQKKELEEAMSWCLRLLDYSGPEKEEAKAMMRTIRSLQGQTGGDVAGERRKTPRRL